MRRSLHRKFLICYMMIGVTGFFLTTAGGSYLTEKLLERSMSKSLYKEAIRIASSDTVIHNISRTNQELIRENISAIAVFQDADIWIINNQNEIIVSSGTGISSDRPIALDSFDPTVYANSYYQIGDFYGHFSSPRLSVIAPITSDMSIKGYIAIHYQMQKLYENRSRILAILQLVFLVVYGLNAFLLLLYRHFVYKPLRQITQGASEYANGNLSYQIPEGYEDEMGYLARTLNYMAAGLNKNGEYQRRFISNVSHDFRSPLTSIKGYVEAMLDGTIPPELQEKYLKVIAYEAGRLEKLTRSLLTLNELDIQKRMMHMSRFDINEVIKTTAAAFEGVCIGRKILLELLLSGRELFVLADMEQIQQVLYNLLDNAVKFSNDGSSIILETTEKNDKVFVSVKDQGCGIPRQSLNRIWERFYKTDVSRGKDRKGTGLGLSIVREIINAHGQNINVISTEGIGTEFIFTLEKAR